MRMACGERRGSGAVRGVRGPAAAVASPALLVELVVHAVDQGLPARLDHVVRHAHRPPALVLVPRLDEHAHHRLGPLLVAEHAHLVVVEPHVLDLGVELAEGLAQRAVEGVDRPVPLRRRVLDLPVRALEHDGRLGDRRLALGPLLVDRAKADQAVEAHAVAVDRLAHEELERRLGALEGEALRLEVLQVAQQRRHRRLVRLEVEAEPGGLVEEVRAPGQVRDQHALAVADQVRVDVLVGGRVLLHRGHVEPALVSEGALSDEGLALVGLQVGELVDQVGDLRELLQLRGADAVMPVLQLQHRDHRHQVRVPAALAEAVDRALHLHAAVRDALDRVRDRQLAVVVAVDAEHGRDRGPGRVHAGPDRGRQRAAARVAQADEGRARVGRGAHARERVVAVGCQAVEEMLGVEDHLVGPRAQVGDGVVDDLQVLRQRDAQVLAHVEVPGLADDGDHRRLGGETEAEVAVVGGLHARPAGRAEGRHLRVLESEALDGAEELLVAWVRARPAALDVVEAEVVEALGDAELVLEREGDVLGLRPVAQRRVVELDAPHGRFTDGGVGGFGVVGRFPMKASCSARTASSVYLASITTEILISEVEIIWMLIPSLESTSNMRAAMPACVRMPTPTIDTLATSSCPAMPCAPISRAVASRSPFAVSKSPRDTVKVKSVVPSALAFWMIMSTTMLARAIGPKTRAASPGRSGTRSTVSLASSRSYATPATDTSSMAGSSSTTHVPSASLKEERTWTGTR